MYRCNGDAQTCRQQMRQNSPMIIVRQIRQTQTIAHTQTMATKEYVPFRKCHRFNSKSLN